MRNIIMAIIIGSLAMPSLASADVDSIKIRFGGGCVSSNTDSSCTIKSVFSGTELEAEGAALYVCATPKSCRLYSSRFRPVPVDGSAVVMRFRNIPGACFQIRTAPNGNEKPDVQSRTLCEK